MTGPKIPISEDTPAKELLYWHSKYQEDLEAQKSKSAQNRRGYR